MAKEGDLAAFETLVRRHAPVVHRVASLLAGSASEGEDAAQDALVRAYAALERYDPGRPFRPWLLTIVANTARNRRRGAGRRLRYELAAVPPEAAQDPEAAAIAAEARAALLEAVERLPERERQVVACRYLLELSETETAAALGLRAGTVKSRLARARGRLADALRPDDVLPQEAQR